MKELHAMIADLMELNGTSESLRCMAEVVTICSLDKMRSPHFSQVLEGKQVLWTALQSMRRLAERDPDPSVRASYFSICRVMNGAFVSKEYCEALDHLADEVEDFVEERDAFLPVDDETHTYIMRALDLKHFHQLIWARKKEALNRHDGCECVSE